MLRFRAPKWLWGVLALQLLVPAYALAQAPAPFGFQMYSGLGWTEVQVVDSSGASHEVELAEHVSRVRDDTDWRYHLPEHLCRELDDTRAVIVVRHKGAREHRCP